MNNSIQKITQQVLVHIHLILLAGPKDLSSFQTNAETLDIRSAKHWRPNSPLLRLQPRRWVPGDEEESSHGVHVTEGCKKPKQGPAQVRGPNPGHALLSVPIMLPNSFLSPGMTHEQSGDHKVSLWWALNETDYRSLIKSNTFQLEIVNVSTCTSFLRKTSQRLNNLCFAKNNHLRLQVNNIQVTTTMETVSYF